MSESWARLATCVALVTPVVLGVASSARAESTLVVLARSPASRASDAEVANRVRGELLADGFNVQWVDTTPDEDRIGTLARLGRTAGSAVAAGLWVAEDTKTVELVLFDELTGRSLVRRLEAAPDSGGQAPEVIARRSVDFLRASMLDFVVESLRSVASAVRRPPPPAPKGEPVIQTQRPRWALEAGVGVLGSFQGVGPAAMPVARLRLEPSPIWQPRITAAWLGTQSIVETPTGSASVEQGVALAECTVHFWRSRFVHPFVSLGAGIYYVGVVSSAYSPDDRGARSNAISFASDAGLGVASELGSHFELSLEAQAVVADPGVAIRFLGVDSARIGRPSVLGTLTIAGWI